MNHEADHSSNADNWTVGKYLVRRLKQLGVGHMFGVPGEHIAGLLGTLKETGEVAWVADSNELTAAYAADAYARVVGLSAVAGTYAVGPLCMVNAIAGAFVERIPVVVINGSPSREQWLTYQAIGVLASHMSSNKQSNLDIFRPITVDAQVLDNASRAPAQIDAAIEACISELRPVYFEVQDNLWNSPCAAPVGMLKPRPRPVTPRNDEMREKAVKAAVKRIEERGKPILWGGVEIDRFKLHKEFQTLVEETGIPYTTTIMGKAILSENHEQFHGVYNGKSSLPEVRRMFKECANCRIGLGAWTTSKNLGGDHALGEDWIKADHGGVMVGSHFFPDVELGEFIRDLCKALVDLKGRGFYKADYYAECPDLMAAEEFHDRAGFIAHLSSRSEDDKRLTYDSFYARINTFLDEAASGSGTPATSPYVAVSDAAFALLGAQNLKMAERSSFYSQTSWLAIGYSVGAVTGFKVGRPDKRPLVFVGDGSFQETAVGMSSQVRLGHNSVVFVLNNTNFYGISQMLGGPGYYCPGNNEPDAFNHLHPWNYARLAEVFGNTDRPMHGVVVGTHGELDKVLARVADANDPINRGPILVQVQLPIKDYPEAIGYKVKEHGCSAQSGP